jgi:hypothetical protein
LILLLWKLFNKFRSWLFTLTLEYPEVAMGKMAVFHR